MVNEFCHVEIPTTNFEVSKKFYESVFNWKVSIVPEMNYALFETGGLDGGFDKVEEVKPGGVVLYILADDIKETLKKIESAGGKVLERETLISEEYGYFALFQDPEGNVLGLWRESKK
ncbi:MAG: VOC family protein [Candidatus Methanofastidiosia archaeon]